MFALVAATHSSTAVIWENGSIRDLGTLNVYRGARANAVNDRGQVVGDGDVLPFGNHLFF